MWAWDAWQYYREPVMPPGVKVISTVEGPMIPLATLRQQCEIVPTYTDSDGVESHPDDGLLLGYLDAAIEHAEDYTGLTIALRTLEIALDGFPWTCDGRSPYIEIPRNPVISIESFSLGEGGSEAGSDGELDLGDNFTLNDYRVPARLYPVGSWPSVTRSPDLIKIRFLAGYMNGDYFDTDYAGAQALPKAIRQAILLLTGHFYANREASVEAALSTIPLGFESLLQLKRIRLGMA